MKKHSHFMTDIKSLCSTAVRVPSRLVDGPHAHTTRQIVILIIMHSDAMVLPRKTRNTHVLDHLKKLIF